MKEKNFVLTVENYNSPIVITVPHGGIKNRQGSWLDLFFKKRTRLENEKENVINGEKIVLGGDGQIMHIVSDILKQYQANAVVGLLPRCFVDYNRFVPKVAYADKKLKPFYDEYHNSINEIIFNLVDRYENIFLFDFHGFGHQPFEGAEFDIVLGTDNQSSPRRADKLLYKYFKNRKYNVFCAGMDGLLKESEMYRGDMTNLHYYRTYGIDTMLVEISPKFRSSKIIASYISGQKIAKDFAKFFKELEKLRGETFKQM